LPDPLGSVSDVLFIESKFLKLGANRVGALGSHRRQDNLAVFDLHFEVVSGADSADQAPGQCEPIPGGQFGEDGHIEKLLKLKIPCVTRKHQCRARKSSPGQASEGHPGLRP
jgi:hypothetical protein